MIPMEIRKSKFGRMMGGKLTEYKEFYKKVNELVPSVEGLLNSALRTSQGRHGVSISLSDRSLVLEDPETMKYNHVIFQLTIKRDPALIPAGEQVLFKDLFSESFVKSLEKASGPPTPFSVKVLKTEGKIDGFEILHGPTGITIRAIRKSTMDRLVGLRDAMSSVFTDGPGHMEFNLLRTKDELDGGTQTGPNYGITESAISVIDSLYSKKKALAAFTDAGVLENLDLARKRARNVLSNLSEIFPEDADRIVGRMLGVSDGTDYGRMMTVTCLGAVMLGSETKVKAIDRLDKLVAEGIGARDFVMLSNAMGSEKEKVMAAIDFRTMRIEIGTISESQKGKDTLKGYDLLADLISQQKAGP